MIAYAVVNPDTKKAIALFATETGADSYAAIYDFCIVMEWEVPEEVFDSEA